MIGEDFFNSEASLVTISCKGCADRSALVPIIRQISDGLGRTAVAALRSVTCRDVI
jgi:hypothetical protein